jgi:hypothetical protein
LYKAWDSMKDRCFHDKKYVHITFCDDWKNFLHFKEWAYQNGYEDGLSLDRIDNSKGYEPSNCRWVTWDVQMQNRTNARYITLDGITKHLNEWLEELGVKKNTFYVRMKRGWNEQQSLLGKR